MEKILNYNTRKTVKRGKNGEITHERKGKYLVPIKPTAEETQKAKEALKASGIIESFWHIDDIIYRAKQKKQKINKKQAREIADIMARRHDAEIGINWDVIDINIDMYFNP